MKPMRGNVDFKGVVRNVKTSKRAKKKNTWFKKKTPLNPPFGCVDHFWCIWHSWRLFETPFVRDWFHKVPWNLRSPDNFVFLPQSWRRCVPNMLFIFFGSLFIIITIKTCCWNQGEINIENNPSSTDFQFTGQRLYKTIFILILN